MADNTLSIIDQLTKDISDKVGSSTDNELNEIQSGFDKALADALKSFNSNAFDDDGFIRKFRDINMPDKADQAVVKNVLNNIKSDYISADTLNQTEILLRRDIYNVCTQMPEMHDVVYANRDAIIECNVATGEVSRSLSFLNHENDESLLNIARDVEERHDILMSIKNFIVPKGLMHGELNIQVTPYAKLFAELEVMADDHNNKHKSFLGNQNFKESIPNYISTQFRESASLYNEENLKILTESVSDITKTDSADVKKINGTKLSNESGIAKEGAAEILKSIEVYNGSSVMMSEMGIEGMKQFILREYKEHKPPESKPNERNFMEYQMQNFNGVSSSMYSQVDQDGIDFQSYKDIKGAYVKYLDGLRTVPIRMDRRIIGYYYVSTTMDLQLNAANPNGIVDMSFQNYTRDRNIVEQLANMVIKSFDKSFLNKNIQLKNEIVDVIMAHKFAEGKLSFIYIPENEVIHIALNEDENGRGHSILEPSLFSARLYLMLTMYNVLYILNNTTTRVHYLKQSGLNKDYASQIQRTMRKFQQRRITIDDIYSYSGVLNKVGGMGEMVLPAGRNDFKALETDTIPAVENPINIEFLEQQRRQAISSTASPNMMIINAIDEVDFAKTLELANARFQSSISSYKIDFNRGLTKFYQRLLQYETDLDPDIIRSFRFQFNQTKQQDLAITADMITNFNNLLELAEPMYFTKAQLEDENGNATPIRMRFRRKLARKYLSQLELDELDDIAEEVLIDAGIDNLTDKSKNLKVDKKELK